MTKQERERQRVKSIQRRMQKIYFIVMFTIYSHLLHYAFIASAHRMWFICALHIHIAPLEMEMLNIFTIENCFIEIFLAINRDEDERGLKAGVGATTTAARWQLQQCDGVDNNGYIFPICREFLDFIHRNECISSNIDDDDNDSGSSTNKKQICMDSYRIPVQFVRFWCKWLYIVHCRFDISL